jgi:hypothetical protein
MLLTGGGWGERNNLLNSLIARPYDNAPFFIQVSVMRNSVALLGDDVTKFSIFTLQSKHTHEKPSHFLREIRFEYFSSVIVDSTLGTHTYLSICA